MFIKGKISVQCPRLVGFIRPARWFDKVHDDGHQTNLKFPKIKEVNA